MRIGGSEILTCPFCGKEKRVMVIDSGNTFGGEWWSDNKRISPMLPYVSAVQKCPECGKYYYKGSVKSKLDREVKCGETGELTYPELKEAFAQLDEEGFGIGIMRQMKEGEVRMMLHHAYNDYFYRSGDGKVVPEEDKAMFHENALWLIKYIVSDKVMKAEFYREIGEMEEAKKMLDSVVLNDKFLEKIARGIRERLEKNDCVVFRIE